MADQSRRTVFFTIATFGWRAILTKILPCIEKYWIFVFLPILLCACVSAFVPSLANLPSGCINGPLTDQCIQDKSSELIAFYTKRLAIVTIVLATVSFIQGWLIYRQLKLAETEFNTSHRPKIRTRFFRPNIRDKATRIAVFFQIVNEGDTSAKITEVRTLGV
jgi:hypothetical protein